MTTCSHGRSTDTASLKRPREPVAPDLSKRKHRSHHHGHRSVSVPSSLSQSTVRPSAKRRSLSRSVGSIMLTQQPSIMSGSFPSFMSVYGSQDSKEYEGERGKSAVATNNEHEGPSQCSDFHDTQSYSTADSISQRFGRRNSSNSGLSFSTESSPTTTSSTFDSPLVAEMPCSPSSSPESASSAAPPKSFQSSTPSSDPPAGGSFPLYQPVLSPHAGDESRRNIKNLTLDMKLPAMLRPATSTGTEGLLHPFSAPTSPLKEPLKTGRRKPTNLTIRTPGFNQLTFPRPGEVPPTPSQKSMLLNQPLSSPALPTLISPTLGPPNGMCFNMPNIAQRVQNDATPSPHVSLSMVSSLPDLREDEYQPPRSQEAPERGYTDGPVRIYDTGVFLYLEPTAEEASRFDLVVNCAKEIKDPFEEEHKSGTVMSVWRTHDAERTTVEEPQTAMSEVSFKSAFEWPAASDPATPTPTTPKANLDSPLKRPEYLHVPWDHNSEILGDLYPLCEIIDDRVKKGRKVLIHCQLGVSRSASLIIAYGLYKGYEADFHSMYMTVKKRSRWVGPNMSLIYQLTDFRSKCARGDYPGQSKAADPAWFVHGYDITTTPVAVSAPTPALAPTLEGGSQPILTVIEKPPLRLNKELPPVPPMGATSPVVESIVAPTSSLETTQQEESTSSQQISTIKRSASKLLTFRAKNNISSHMFIPPHRPNTVEPLNVPEPKPFMDLACQDVPESPSIFSPRAAEFMASPFGVDTAGDLVTSAPKRRRPPPGAFPGGSEWRQSLRQSMDVSQEIAKLLSNDPRSPHQTAEAREIIRNIDDVL